MKQTNRALSVINDTNIGWRNTTQQLYFKSDEKCMREIVSINAVSDTNIDDNTRYLMSIVCVKKIEQRNEWIDERLNIHSTTVTHLYSDIFTSSDRIELTSNSEYVLCDNKLSRLTCFYNQLVEGDNIIAFIHHSNQYNNIVLSYNVNVTFNFGIDLQYTFNGERYLLEDASRYYFNLSENEKIQMNRFIVNSFFMNSSIANTTYPIVFNRSSLYTTNYIPDSRKFIRIVSDNSNIFDVSNNLASNEMIYKNCSILAYHLL